MSEQLAEKFIEALGRLEAERDLETISALFSEESEVGNVVSPEKFHGREGAREFWGSKYRDTFGEVRSTFRNVFATGTRAALEWTTEGTAQDGTPVRYEGVSILETDGERVTRFCAYFDAGALGRQLTGKAHA
ncbi:MAG TPA: nuclear transport factor 2 family protein [Pyrinomonadaceae bacterium]|jgi:ketosteroid isomerase-like protein|nr:nuclear transport factor 2 family protein [Pyrinomonadaceae bacterium]